MASACVNRVSISPETLLDCPQKYSSYSWFTHRLSITRDEAPKHITKNPNLADVADSDPVKKGVDPKEDEETKEFDGFEFRLDDPVIMLPADELFSDGKLVPMRMSVATSTETQSEVVRCSEDIDFPRKSFVPDPYVFSPRAPRCSSRWKELLGFKKLYNNNNNNNNNNNISNTKGENNSKRISISSSNGNGTGAGATRSFRQFLNRSSKPTNDSPINLPLLKDPDNESSSLSSVSSRPSLSSSSSGHELEDLPRMSLDSDKPRNININFKLHKNTNPNTSTRPKSRMLKTKTKTQTTEQQQRPISTRVGRTSIRRSSESLPTVAGSGNRGLSVDSPRMNSSGKIVFHSLERSSSSPSSLIGGPRFKHRGMERSYSANVRITPVLNVPVCSLSKTGSMFGFPIFSSQQNNVGINRGQRVNASNNR